MTAEEIRTCMDAVADAKNRGECEDGEQERMAAMMIAEIAAQLAELNANLNRIFNNSNPDKNPMLRVDNLI